MSLTVAPRPDFGPRTSDSFPSGRALTSEGDGPGNQVVEGLFPGGEGGHDEADTEEEG